MRKHSVILSSYLTVSIRHLLRHKFYTCLNIIGLAIGVGCLIVSILYFDYHLQWDAGHEKAERIYRVIRHIKDADGARYSTGTHPVGPHLKAEIPEIEEAARVLNREMWIAHEDRGFNGWVATADSSFTRIFTIPMVKGNAKIDLLNPGSCFISQKLGTHLFGNEDPMGKTISAAFKWVEGDYLITGIMQDAPEQTYPLLQYDVLTTTCNFKGSRQEWIWDNWPNNWFVTPLRTYVLLHENTDLDAFQQKLNAFSERHLRPDAPKQTHYVAQPLNEMHLYTQRDYNLPEGEDIARCYTILGIGILVLFLACLNYINLVTAQSPIRAREVGLRKVSGATRSQLITQFLGESMLVASIAFVIALGLAHLFIPFVNGILSVDLFLNKVSTTLIVLLPIAIIPLIGLLAGFYPAFILSSHAPVKTVTGHQTYGGKRSWLRTTLVVFQFCVSSILIVSTLVVHQQIEYMRNKGLGFDTDNIVLMPIFLRHKDMSESLQKAETIRNEIARIPGVSNASAVFLPPDQIGLIDFKDVQAEGATDIQRLYYQGVDREYFDTFDIPFVTGGIPKSMASRNRTDNSVTQSVIINEQAGRVLGWGEQAHGKRFFIDYDQSDGGTFRAWYEVAGVVKDYHNQSLQHGIEPTFIQIPGAYKHMAVRLAPGDVTHTLSQLEDVWHMFLPDQPFEYEFMNDIVQQHYKSEMQLRKVSIFFSILSIIVGCLGVLGLVTYTAQQRRKEMGIRKVLGATSRNILMLLTSDFLKLTTVSFFIAWPIAYVLGTNWLTNFTYRMSLGLSPFLINSILTLCLVAIAIGIQSWRSATADPVESLRSE